MLVLCRIYSVYPPLLSWCESSIFHRGAQLPNPISAMADIDDIIAELDSTESQVRKLQDDYKARFGIAVAQPPKSTIPQRTAGPPASDSAAPSTTGKGRAGGRSALERLAAEPEGSSRAQSSNSSPRPASPRKPDSPGASQQVQVLQSDNARLHGRIAAMEEQIAQLQASAQSAEQQRQAALDKAVDFKDKCQQLSSAVLSSKKLTDSANAVSVAALATMLSLADEPAPEPGMRVRQEHISAAAEALQAKIHQLQAANEEQARKPDTTAAAAAAQEQHQAELASVKAELVSLQSKLQAGSEDLVASATALKAVEERAVAAETAAQQWRAALHSALGACSEHAEHEQVHAAATALAAHQSPPDAAAMQQLTAALQAHASSSSRAAGAADQEALKQLRAQLQAISGLLQSTTQASSPMAALAELHSASEELGAARARASKAEAEQQRTAQQLQQAQQELQQAKAQAADLRAQATAAQSPERASADLQAANLEVQRCQGAVALLLERVVLLQAALDQGAAGSGGAQSPVAGVASPRLSGAKADEWGPLGLAAALEERGVPADLAAAVASAF